MALVHGAALVRSGPGGGKALARTGVGGGFSAPGVLRVHDPEVAAPPGDQDLRQDGGGPPPPLCPPPPPPGVPPFVLKPESKVSRTFRKVLTRGPTASIQRLARCGWRREGRLPPGRTLYTSGASRLAGISITAHAR